MSRPTVVLCGVLDWGLGHATRSIPVIRAFLRAGAVVHLAGSGSSGLLLRQEFPELPFHPLPGYAPRYQSSGFLPFRLLTQIPHFLRVIEAEHRAVEKLATDIDADIVLSDNRYGCYAKGTLNILLAHQLQLLPLPGMGQMTSVVNRKLRQWMDRFDEIWIPDQPEEKLAGPVWAATTSRQRYVGWLSRFQASEEMASIGQVLAVVSGPEPQRTHFFRQLVEVLSVRNDHSIIVCGEPDKQYQHVKGSTEIVSHVDSRRMGQLLRAPRVVMSRSGYSSLMDYIALGKKAVLVPTPQQTEQMMLAREVDRRGLAPSVPMGGEGLDVALKRLDRYSGFDVLHPNGDLLEAAVREILNH